MFDSAWYLNLVKPQYAPPDWLFAPVWLILYVLIFISFIVYLLTKSNSKRNGIIYFLLQLLFNISWTPVFFIFKNIFGALVIIILTDIFSYFTLKEFHKVAKIAALLFLPYFLWLLYATYLNIGYLYLN